MISKLIKKKHNKPIPYIEVLGQSGSGKSTILKELEKTWTESSGWILGPAYSKSEIWERPIHSLPSKKFTENHQDFIAFIFNFIADYAKHDTYKEAEKIPLMFWMNSILSALDLKEERANEKLLIMDECFITRIRFLLQDDNNSSLSSKQILGKMLMPVACVWIEADPVIAAERVYNRPSVIRGHENKNLEDIVRYKKRQVTKLENDKKIIKKALPFMELNGLEDPEKNAEKISKFIEKIRNE